MSYKKDVRFLLTSFFVRLIALLFSVFYGIIRRMNMWKEVRRYGLEKINCCCCGSNGYD